MEWAASLFDEGGLKALGTELDKDAHVECKIKKNKADNRNAVAVLNQVYLWYKSGFDVWSLLFLFELCEPPQKIKYQ